MLVFTEPGKAARVELDQPVTQASVGWERDLLVGEDHRKLELHSGERESHGLVLGVVRKSRLHGVILDRAALGFGRAHRADLHRAGQVATNQLEQRDVVVLGHAQGCLEQRPEFALGHQVGEEGRELAFLAPKRAMQSILELLPEHRSVLLLQIGR
jgi:hypothetical protein